MREYVAAIHDDILTNDSGESIFTGLSCEFVLVFPVNLNEKVSRRERCDPSVCLVCLDIFRATVEARISGQLVNDNIHMMIQGKSYLVRYLYFSMVSSARRGG